ncbi:hypothetical protein AAHZ94_00260 [Streptomyces sp. HSW2009]|uniref:hypothetical protein n=1 Tax=Streptomyces sp. HSW2009 TaxID=3142890 RepID=UPI0032ED4FB2
MHTDHAARTPSRRMGISAVASYLPQREVTSYGLQEQSAAPNPVHEGLRPAERVLPAGLGGGAGVMTMVWEKA